MFNQKGTAIFTALFMVAIVSAISVALISYQRLDIFRTQQMITADRANQYTQGALYWAVGELKNPGLVPSSPSIKWPKTIPATLIQSQQGVIEAELDYYNPRFNLNSLKQSGQVTKFIEVVNGATGEFPAGWAEEVSKHIRAWISASGSEYAETYLSQAPPFRMAKQPMISVSELRLIEGVSAQQYEGLAPLLSVYPEGGDEDYFLLHTTVTLGDQQQENYALLQRRFSQGKVVIKLIWQVLGAH